MEGLITASEAAELLAIDKNTLTNWRSQNKGPQYIKQGRMVRYRKSDVIEWIGNNTVKPEGK